VRGGGGRNYEGRFRDFRRTASRAHPQSRTGSCDGQPRRSQGREGARIDPRERLRALLYLPPYSPDLNPIEEAFSKVKALLRRTGARTREALIEAMGRALEAVTDEDARGFFEHRGYRLPAQSL
jgi:transposase